MLCGVYNTPQVKNPSGVGADKVLQVIQQVNDRITAMDTKFTKAISDLDKFISVVNYHLPQKREIKQNMMYILSN